MSVEATERTIVKKKRCLDRAGNLHRTIAISLPRISCVDGDFEASPQRQQARSHRAPSDHNPEPMDWSGRPLFRPARTTPPRATSSAAAVVRQHYQRELCELRKQLRLSKITAAHQRHRRDRKAVRRNAVSTRILVSVANASGYSVSDLKGRRKIWPLVKWRMVAAYLICKYRPVSYTYVGNLLGGRDHATIIHSVQRVESNPKEFRTQLRKMEALL